MGSVRCLREGRRQQKERDDGRKKRAAALNKRVSLLKYASAYTFQRFCTVSRGKVKCTQTTGMFHTKQSQKQADPGAAAKQKQEEQPLIYVNAYRG